MRYGIHWNHCKLFPIAIQHSASQNDHWRGR